MPNRLQSGNESFVFSCKDNFLKYGFVNAIYYNGDTGSDWQRFLVFTLSSPSATILLHLYLVLPGHQLAQWIGDWTEIRDVLSSKLNSHVGHMVIGLDPN